MPFNKKKFAAIQKKGHTLQSIWFLNGFFEDFSEAELEQVWKYTHKMIEIETGRPKFYGARSRNSHVADDAKEGFSVDQFMAHRFLEHFGETKTASALRKDLSTIDVDKNNQMSITEYLMFKFSKSAEEVIDAPQGGNDAEIKAAEAQMTETREQLSSLVEKLEVSRIAAAESDAAFKAAIKAASDAGRRAGAAAAALKVAERTAADCKAAEEPFRKAEAAVQAAVDELNAQQSAYDNAIADAEKRSNDSNLGNVKRNKAKNELAQLRAEDPLPLSRAKITQASALKKSKKARKKFKKATAAAEDAKEVAAEAAQISADAKAASEAAAADAEKKKHAAEEAAAEVEEAVKQTEEALAECTANFEALKKKGSVPRGKIWWMEREMKEVRKYMPGRK